MQHHQFNGFPPGKVRNDSSTAAMVAAEP